MHENKEILKFYKKQINNFLKDNLKIELHKEKSKIYLINQGINFLGFRNFYHHKILKKNKRKLLRNKINSILKEYEEIKDYNKFIQRIEAISAYIENANTYNLRKKLIKIILLSY